jgi:hypothetical protein
LGADGAQAQLAAPLENTLFFAGEATDTSGNNGTVHGAIASGYRAAKETMESGECSNNMRQWPPNTTDTLIQLVRVGCKGQQDIPIHGIGIAGIHINHPVDDCRS